MPTSTFFRLPEEKRARLMEACWAEVSQVRFSEVSINRIIAAARIPRGSFYQYFEDKDELIRYLLEDMKEYFVSLLRDILTKSQGDLFALPLMAYDRFVGHQGYTDPMLTKFIQIVTLNKGMDMQNFMGGPCEFLPDQIWEAVDASRLRRSDREYADHVFHMVCAVLAFAVVEALREPNKLRQMRETLRIRMDLLRYGGAAEGYKEETP